MRPLADQRILITGSSDGLGRALAAELTGRGASVIVHGRDAGRVDQARRETGAAEALVADLGDLGQVRALADATGELDTLVNNAGVIVARRRESADGHELTFAVNHLSHFLLANLLRDRLAGGRLVCTSSAAYLRGTLDPADLSQTARRYRVLTAYGAAKQANILFAAEAARRWPDVLPVSYHPGVVRTRFGSDNPVIAAFFRFYPGLRTPERGADTLVWLATTPADDLTPGAFYHDRRPQVPTGKLINIDLAGRLWAASEEAVGLTAR